MRKPAKTKHSIVGTWRLTLFTEENLTTGAVTHPLGPRPKALVIYTGDGYVSTIFTATDRRRPVSARATNEETVALYRSMVAFAGRYVLQGETLTYHPEVSWNEAWNGTVQERRFIVDGDRLEVRSVPVVSSLTGTNTVFSLVWQRAR
jgi:Lipocalin-like domain